MIQAKCTQKFRDKRNHIYGYRLIDLNGQTQDVKAEALKHAIASGKIHIINLTLTKDGRLVDTTEKQLQSKSLGTAPQAPVDKEEVFFDKVGEVIKRFCTTVGGCACGFEELDGEEGVDRVQQIAGVYYPDNYPGNPEDREHCYGVTFGIEYNSETQIVFMDWQGDNGMAREEFGEEAQLVKPLYSDKNIEIIHKTMNKFIERVQKWIYNDKNDIKQDYTAELLKGVNQKELRGKFKEAIKNGEYPKKQKYSTSDIISFGRQIGMIKS